MGAELSLRTGFWMLSWDECEQQPLQTPVFTYVGFWESFGSSTNSKTIKGSEWMTSLKALRCQKFILVREEVGEPEF